MAGCKKHPYTNKMGRPEYWTVERIKELEETLWEHVNDPESVDILGWRGKQRLTRSQVDNIRDKSPDFRDAYECAKAILGERRQKMGLVGEWHAGLVMRDDWAYCEYAKARQDFLKDKEVQANQSPAGFAEAAEIKALKEQNEKLLAEIEKLKGNSDS